MEKILSPLSGAVDDAELWALTMAAHQPTSPGHSQRGFTVSGTDAVHTQVQSAHQQPTYSPPTAHIQPTNSPARDTVSGASPCPAPTPSTLP